MTYLLIGYVLAGCMLVFQVVVLVGSSSSSASHKAPPRIFYSTTSNNNNNQQQLKYHDKFSRANQKQEWPPRPIVWSDWPRSCDEIGDNYSEDDAHEKWSWPCASDNDTVCVVRELREHRRRMRVANWKSQMCSSPRNMWSHCYHQSSLQHVMMMPVANVTMTHQQCANMRLTSSQPIDVIIPWVNMTEAGYFDDWHPHFWSSAKSLHKDYPYRHVGLGREPFSEVMFTIRSILGPNGPPIRRVLILYDDQIHGPPTFLKPLHPKVMAVPTSLLVAATGFVNIRRRMQTSMSMLHRLPGLSDYFLFLPDDVVMLGQRLRQDWSSMLHSDGRLRSFTSGGSGIAKASKTAMLLYASLEKKLPSNVMGLLHARSRREDESIFQVDVHGPFLMKRCYVQELHDTLGCELDLLKCNPNLGPRVCDLEGYHFQLMTQNYARVREAFSANDVASKNNEQLMKQVAFFLNSGANVPRTVASQGEIHITRCEYLKTYEEDLKKIPLGYTWLNLQGDGVSDEYRRCDAAREMIDKWYTATFPQKGDWEK